MSGWNFVRALKKWLCGSLFPTVTGDRQDEVEKVSNVCYLHSAKVSQAHGYQDETDNNQAQGYGKQNCYGRPCFFCFF